MALDPPGPVVMALNILGLPWPGVNEDQLRDWAGSVRQFSGDICDNSSHVNQTMRELAGTSQSAVIDSAAGFWETHHQLLVNLRGPLDAFAGALDLAADEVVAQKWAVIGAAGAMAAEFTATQVGAFFTFGADEAALPAELALTREAVKEALEKLANALIGAGLQYAMQEIVDHLNRTMGSILNTAFEVHMEVHSLRILYKTLRDAVERIRSIIDTIKEIASNAHSRNVNRDLADSSGGGGWGEIIRVVEEGVKDFFQDLFKNLPGLIIQGLEALALGLIKLADRAEAADSDEPPSVVSNIEPAGNVRLRSTAGGAQPAGGDRQALLRELADSGVKHDPDQIVRIARGDDGQVKFLENGNDKAGLEHLMRHAPEFEQEGIPAGELPDYVMAAATKGRVVGYQGKGRGRQILEFEYGGQTRRIALSIGSNGFIVGGNPVGFKAGETQ